MGKSTEKKAEAVKSQQDRYVAKTKKNDKGWSVKQFGKRVQAWKKMSEAGKK